jgi:hypothetical protein
LPRVSPAGQGESVQKILTSGRVSKVAEHSM